MNELTKLRWGFPNKRIALVEAVGKGQSAAGRLSVEHFFGKEVRIGTDIRAIFGWDNAEAAARQLEVYRKCTSYINMQKMFREQGKSFVQIYKKTIEDVRSATTPIEKENCEQQAARLINKLNRYRQINSELARAVSELTNEFERLSRVREVDLVESIVEVVKKYPTSDIFVFAGEHHVEHSQVHNALSRAGVSYTAVTLNGSIYGQ